MKPVVSPLQGHWSFFQQFLKHPLQLGSIVPSSRYLEQRIVAQAAAGSAGIVVELGPGSGGTTRALLTAMAPDARLLSIELNRDLHALVSRIGDPRLIAHRGDARDLCETMGQYNLAAPDAVVSGIPFSTMDPGVGRAILAAIAVVLPAGGRFVAYQVSSRVAELARPILGEPEVALEPLNIPPMRVYCWTRGTGSRASAG